MNILDDIPLDSNVIISICNGGRGIGLTAKTGVNSSRVVPTKAELTVKLSPVTTSNIGDMGLDNRCLRVTLQVRPGESSNTSHSRGYFHR